MANICLLCNKVFDSGSQTKRKYCSPRCYHRSLRGKPTWLKGLTKETDERVAKISKALTCEKIQVKCKNCETKFEVQPHRANAKYCSKQCFYTVRKRSTPWNKGLTKDTDERISRGKQVIPLSGRKAWNKGLTKDTDERIKKISESEKGRKLSDKTRQKISEALNGRKAWNKGLTKEDPRIKKLGENVSKTMKKLYTSGKLIPRNKGRGWIELFCKNCGKKFVVRKFYVRRAEKNGWKKMFCSWKCYKEGYSITEKHRKKMIESLKLKWENPEFREKMLIALSKGCLRRPTKPEQKLKEILDKYFPGEFGYNGDFSLHTLLIGLVPDFINLNGKKLLIEVFGDYWHTKRIRNWHATEQGRKDIYSQLGYKTLIIWEHELISKKLENNLMEEEIAGKIRNFMGEKSENIP